MHGLFSSYTPSLKAHISHDQWVQEYHSWWWPDHSISPQRERNDSINRSQSQSHTPSFFTTSTHLSTSNKHHTSLSSRSSTFFTHIFILVLPGEKWKERKFWPAHNLGMKFWKPLPSFSTHSIERASHQIKTLQFHSSLSSNPNHNSQFTIQILLSISILLGFSLSRTR